MREMHCRHWKSSGISGLEIIRISGREETKGGGQGRKPFPCPITWRIAYEHNDGKTECCLENADSHGYRVEKFCMSYDGAADDRRHDRTEWIDPFK